MVDSAPAKQCISLSDTGPSLFWQPLIFDARIKSLLRSRCNYDARILTSAVALWQYASSVCLKVKSFIVGILPLVACASVGATVQTLTCALLVGSSLSLHLTGSFLSLHFVQMCTQASSTFITCVLSMPHTGRSSSKSVVPLVTERNLGNVLLTWCSTKAQWTTSKSNWGTRGFHRGNIPDESYRLRFHFSELWSVHTVKHFSSKYARKIFRPVQYWKVLFDGVFYTASALLTRRERAWLV